MPFLRNDEIFKNFRGPFYDDIISREDLYLWSNEVLKNYLENESQ